MVGGQRGGGEALGRAARAITFAERGTTSAGMLKRSISAEKECFSQVSYSSSGCRWREPGRQLCWRSLPTFPPLLPFGFTSAVHLGFLRRLICCWIFQGTGSVCRIVTHGKSQRAGTWLSALVPLPSCLPLGCPAAAPRGIQGTEMLLCIYFPSPLLYYCSC